ncbi:MAG: branched-chain amino acid ABC transporter permease, partial [Deltaproteobacteria bacterium]|nr:branched-chain amino acid ABC transporter permease [Deltaproteobacteria bacterium]
MVNFSEIKKSLLVSLWFVFLTFPIMVIRVNTIEDVIEWRWENMIFVGVGSFFLSILWRYLLKRKEYGMKMTEEGEQVQPSLAQRILKNKKIYTPVVIVVAIFTISFPFMFSLYQTNIMISALIYVMLGLGLNIVVGLAGLLDLGYVAFYAVGAYSYALLNYHYGLNFWILLPVGGALGALFGILLGFPVLRLR